MITHHSASSAVSDQLLDRSAYLVGFNLIEDAAGAAEVILHEGTGATNPQLRIKMAAGDTWLEWLGDTLYFKDGIYVERVTGTTDVFLFVS